MRRTTISPVILATLVAGVLVAVVPVAPAVAQQDVEEIGVTLVERTGPLDPGRCAAEVYAAWPDVPGALGYSVEYYDSHPQIDREDSRGAQPGSNDSPPERAVPPPNRLLTGGYGPCEESDNPLLQVGRFDVRRADEVLPGGRPTAVATGTTTFDRVTVDGSGSRPGPSGDPITRWTWHFGDGSTADGATPPPHRYRAQGSYTVTLVVTDAGGRADVAVLQVTVDQPLEVVAAGVTPSPASYTVADDGQVTPVQVVGRWTVRNAGEEPLSHIEVAIGTGSEAADHVPGQLAEPGARYATTRVHLPGPRGAAGPLAPFDLAPGQAVTVEVIGEGRGEAELTVELTATSADGQTDRASQVVSVDGPDAVAWTVPDRTVLPEPGEPPVQHADFGAYVDPDGFPMDLAVSPLDLCTQQVSFTVDGEPVAALASEPCDFRIELPAEDDYSLSLLVDGEVRRSLEVTIDDRLIAIVGDSYLSGEGNPDLRADTDGAVRWLDDPCNRSYRSAGALAAAELERADPQTSVTLAHMACSGASIAEGLLAPQRQENLTGRPVLSYDQLAFLQGALGDRRVDDMVLGVGANDIQFGPLLYLCVTAENACHAEAVSFTTYVTAESVLGINPVLLNPLTPAAQTAEAARVEPDFDLAAVTVPQVVEAVVTSLCLDAAAGDTTVAVQEVGQADEGFELVMNGTAIDLSGRTPAGPGPAARPHDLAGRPTQQVACNPAAGGGGTNGRRVPITTPLGEDHPAVYETPTGEGVPTEPSPERIGLQPRYTLAGTMQEELIPQLRERYRQLGERLESLDIVDAADVTLLEYFDPTGSSDGGRCDSMLVARPDIGSLRGLAIAGDEVRWARSGMVEPMNAAGALRAGLNGWQYLGGIAELFRTHGYCADDPWVVRLSDSWRMQGSPYGAVHPNAAGHAAIAARLVATLGDGDRTAPAPAPAPRQVPSAPPGSLSAPALPGEQVLEVADLDTAVGDVIAIDTFGPTEHRTITATSPLTIDRPLESLHLAGSPVVAIDALPNGPARDDDAYGPAAALAATLPARTVLEGGDTVEMAIAWSRAAHPDDPDGGRPIGTSGRALLGRSDVFADSLAAGGGQLRGGVPLLLTGRDALDPRTLAELHRLEVHTVHVLGGTAAVSAEVAVALHDAGFTVFRYDGASRVETAAAFASIAHPTTSVAVLARAFGEGTAGFADSMAAGTLAARLGAPVLLTATDALSPATAAYLQRAGVARVHLAGGTAAISQAVADALSQAGIEVVRHAGSGRAETAVAIAGATEAVAAVLVDGGAPDGWADGFAAARWAALHGAPVVLTQADGLPAATASFLAAHDVPIVCGASAAAVCP